MLPIVTITPREQELEAEVKRLKRELEQVRGWADWFWWFW
jgi:hypothetical protein